MSGPNKFPYLVLQNIGGEAADKSGSPKVGKKDGSKPNSRGDANQRGPALLDTFLQPAQGLAYSQVLRESTPTVPPKYEFSSPTSQNSPFSTEFNQALSSISVSQMKAILTAQKELRKPAGSLYPSAAQFSLIPETELIYKRYFPTHEKDPEKPTVSEKENDSNPKEAKERVVRGSESMTSSLDSNISNNTRNIKRPEEAKVSVKASSSNEQTLTNPPGNNKDNPATESRFRRKIHQQLLSINSELERQSSEIADLKKEVKDLRQVTRKGSTDNDSSKARLDTLSKHVVELDGKLDTIQDSISGQEKSILSKLMLFGELSESDSDLDDAGTLKGLDAMSSPSSTKLFLSASNPKRTSSAPAASSSDNSLPRACCNWIPIAPDFDKLLHAVALLNYRMDRNQSMKLCTTNNGATFKHSDVVDLTLFKNGMILGSTGFRSYSTMSVIRFVNEVFNGYLPTELSTQFPDGVVIVLTDKRSIIHTNDVGFNSSGSKLMTKDDPPDLLPGKASCQAFLNRSCRVESTQASTTVSQTSIPLTSSASSMTHLSIFEMLPELKIASRGDRSHPKPKVIMLKINYRKTGQKYKLRVPVKATVKEVKDHLATCLKAKSASDKPAENVGGETCRTYNIILPVPLGKLSCLESTLEDYGITQNVLVYIQENEV